MQKLFQLLPLFLILLFASCEKHQTVITGVDEREANLVVVFLDSKGIIATKIPMPSSGMGGDSKAAPKYMIEVDPKVAIQAMAYLNQNGLPRKRGMTLLELFSGQGLMSSDKEETIRYQAGLEQQIQNTIMMIDGVIDSSVQISFPPTDVTETGLKRITAAVYVKHQGIIDDPNAHLENKIKRLVSGSVNGLDINDVTVVSDRSRYTDISPTSFTVMNPQSQEYINVWSMALSRESVGKFRLLFFSLTIFIAIFTSLTAWLLWKFYPMIRKHGFKEIFKLQPFLTEKIIKEEPAAEDAGT